MTDNAADPPSFERAFALHREGRLAEAEAAYRALIAAGSSEPRLSGLLGALCLQTGRLDEAIALLQHATAAEPRSPTAHANLGLALLGRGEHAQALACCERALALAPAYPEALVTRGNALAGQGRAAEALASYDRALALRADYVEAHANRGRVLESLHRLNDAIAAYGRVVALQPRHVDARFRLANLLLGGGWPREAIAHFDALLEFAPDAAPALVNRGNALAALGDDEAALASYRRAVAAAPNLAEAHANVGDVLHRLWRNDEALAALTRALLLDPGLSEALNIRGSVLVALAQPDKALADLDRAVVLSPAFAEAHANRGNALAELKRYDEALASYARSIELKPDFAGVYCGRGSLRMDRQEYAAALVDFDRAIALDPRHAFALANRAFAYRMLGRPEESHRDFERVLEVAPGHPYAAGGRLHAQLQCCDWTDLERRMIDLRAAVDAGTPAALPFHFLGIATTPGEELACARAFAATERIAEPTRPPPTSAQAHDRIRLAYLSADFHAHATAYLIAGLIEQHDRHRFEVTGISYGADDGGPMRARLRRGFDRFVDARTMDDREVAELMRAEAIDIVVDLKGYTADARTGILQQRPAPVQLNYLGYPGTLGVRYVDYIVADAFVIPPGDERWYSEQVVRLPDSYQANDAHRSIDAHTPPRAELGLPEHGFVFCCFNNVYKILPDQFAIWMRLLSSVPGSVLWLLRDNQAAERNLRREAAIRGVASERLVFAPRAPLPEHLARQRRADLFLDTLPVNAHTTASDALWAGLPVLTCAGGTFAGRVGASLLHAAGQGALITHTPDDYEALALKLATTPKLLASLRAKLARARDTCALFDTVRFTRNLERAFLAMHERAVRGLPPEGFDVPPLAAAAGATR
jgi:predicted O-linked N-acetylglucosamine transferase (SPINDLY family)